MTGGVEFEHTHRAVATFVGFLTLILCFAFWRERKENPKLLKLGLVALTMVVVQGILGGITVLLELPPAVSMAHLALSMIFFAFVIYLGFRSWPGQPASDEPCPTGEILPRFGCAIAAGAVYLQILLGGLVRHTREGVVCGTEIPWCHGEIWPSDIGQIHMLHRYMALLVTLVVLAVTHRAFRQAGGKQRKLARWAAALAPVLVLTQVLLGVLTVTSAIGLLEVTAHLSVGALLFADLIILYLAMGAQVQRQFPQPRHASVSNLGARVQEVIS